MVGRAYPKMNLERGKDSKGSFVRISEEKIKALQEPSQPSQPSGSETRPWFPSNDGSKQPSQPSQDRGGKNDGYDGSKEPSQPGSPCPVKVNDSYDSYDGSIGTFSDSDVVEF